MDEKKVRYDNRRNLPSSSEQILEKSTKGATILMLGQFSTKIITFVLNNLLLRFLSPRIFGITSFLEFISSTVLFFSREAIRLSTLRITQNEEDTIDDSNIKNNPNEKNDCNNMNVLQIAVNFSHVPLYIGIPLSLILTTWQYNNINDYFVSLPFFTWSIFFIWCSIIIELLCEPFFIINQLMLNYSTRSRFETMAVTVGCIVNFSVVYAFDQKWFTGVMDTEKEASKEGIAILAFALDKLFYSIFLFLFYFYDYLKNFAPRRSFNLTLTKIKNHSKNTNSSKDYHYFDSKIFEHFKKVYFQLCFKHLLTEGDKLIINSLCTVEEQGIYSLLSNYGSLVTRLLFAPIEESLRLFLARLLTIQKSKNLKLSMDVLINLTRFYLYLSLMIIVFGPTNSSFLLQFLIGSKWSTTSVLDTIRVYCFYLPFLSLNGIFEAFFQSVATGDQILKHSYFMMIFSGVFLLTSWILIDFLKLSINGLIISNIFNMILRIIYCGTFIIKFYKKIYSNQSSFLFNFQNLKMITLVCILICGVDWLLIGYVKNFKQFSINVALAIALLILILYQEKMAIKQFLGREKVTANKST